MWWRENLFNHRKVLKYYENDCSSFNSISCCNCLISLWLPRIKLFIWSCDRLKYILLVLHLLTIYLFIIHLIYLLPSVCIYTFTSLLLETLKHNFFFFVCFQTLFLSRIYKLACSIIWLWLELIISSFVRYSYFSILLDDNANIFPASLLISYCSFSFLVFTFFLKTLHLRHKRLPDARLVLLFKKEYGSAVNFCKNS